MAIPDSALVFELRCSYTLGREAPARSGTSLSVRENSTSSREHGDLLVYSAGQDQGESIETLDALEPVSALYAREILIPAAEDILARLFRLAPLALVRMATDQKLGLLVAVSVYPVRGESRLIKVHGKVLIDGREYANWGDLFPEISRRYGSEDRLGNRALEALLADQDVTEPLLPEALTALFPTQAPELG